MNSAIGIDLSEDGATANDLNDTDTGPNNLQNYPVLTAAQGGPQTAVDGSLNSGVNTTYTIDFYAGPSCGAAQRYLGSAQATTVGNDVTFHAPSLGTTSSGEFIMATATDPGGNTSEISACTIVP